MVNPIKPFDFIVKKNQMYVKISAIHAHICKCKKKKPSFLLLIFINFIIYGKCYKHRSKY